MRELKFGLVLIVFVVGLIFFYQPVTDFAKSVPYMWSKHGEVLQFVSPEVQKRFDGALPRGSCGNGSGIVVSYSSFYDELSHTYFYSVKNHVDREFYARSDIFLVFLGRAGVLFSPTETLYIKVWDPNPPIEKDEAMHLSDSEYSLSGSGGCDMYFTTPREARPHRLVWGPVH